jgi:hypothetical protein
MGGLSNLVADLVTIIKGVTDSLQVTVTLEKFIGDEKEYEKTIGRRLYADPVSYKVIVESRTRFVSIDDGVQGVQISSIQFLDPVAVDVRDRITLPDGSKPQIVAVEGTANPSGIPYAPKVIF